MEEDCGTHMGVFITCRGLDQGTYMYPKKKKRNKVIHACHL